MLCILLQVSESPVRDVCGLDLPFLDVLDRSATCRIKLPLQSSCDQTKNLFSQDPAVCETEGAVQFCKFNKEVCLVCYVSDETHTGIALG